VHPKVEASSKSNLSAIRTIAVCGVTNDKNGDYRIMIHPKNSKLFDEGSTLFLVFKRNVLVQKSRIDFYTVTED
jgi:hypothetical protein